MTIRYNTLEREVEETEFDDHDGLLCFWDQVEMEESDRWEEEMFRKILMEEVWDALMLLPERTRLMVSEWSAGLTYADLGRAHGISDVRARQIVSGGIGRIRALLLAAD